MYLIIAALPSMLIQHLAYLQNASIYVIFMQFTNLAKHKGINVHNLIKIKQSLNLYVLQNSLKKVKYYTLIQLNLGYQLILHICIWSEYVVRIHTNNENLRQNGKSGLLNQYAYFWMYILFSTVLQKYLKVKLTIKLRSQIHM